MALGKCFESTFTDGEAETYSAGSDTFSVSSTSLTYYPYTSGSSGGGTKAAWSGNLYFCIQDYYATKTLSTGDTLTTTYSDAFDFYTEQQFCIQYLSFTGVTGTSGSSTSSTTYALSGTAGAQDAFTWTWTETCSVNQRVWYCTSLSSSTSCESACTVISASKTTSGSAVSTSATASAVGTTGYIYFCVQDTSESDAFAWYSTQYCIQSIAISSVLGGSNSGTFAKSAGTSVDTVTVSWSRTCSVYQALYQCSAYDTAYKCSTSSYCSYVGYTSSNYYAVTASSLTTGNRLINNNPYIS